MNHLIRLFTDIILETVDAWNRTVNIFRKKPKASLTAANIYWCTHSEWMDRLVAYKQLELWTNNK